MLNIDISEIDPALLHDINDEVRGWALYEAPYEGETVSNQQYQIVFHAGIGRAGIVFCGSGSSGMTSWTDAGSPEEAFDRFINDDLIP